MSTVFIKTSVKEGIITTLCFNGVTYETTATDKYGRRIKAFQVNDRNKAKKNHQKCIDFVTR